MLGSKTTNRVGELVYDSIYAWIELLWTGNGSVVVQFLCTLDKMGNIVLDMAWTFDKLVEALVLRHVAKGYECLSNITFLDIKTLTFRVRHL